MSALPGLPRPCLIGVVHLLPTPGAPRHGGSMEAVLARARADAGALARGGADAVIVENFGDAPFFAERVPAETVAAMALAVAEVRRAAGPLPVGVNVLRNDARAALGLCAATGAAFLRVNVHTGTMATDQGLIEGRAAETLRERARLCPDVRVLADVHVKHARPLNDESLVEAALDAWQRGGADALILSGERTGSPPAAESFAELREHVGACPLLIGSGLDLDSAARLLPLADGAIVGTALKHGGRVDQPVEEARVARLHAELERHRR